MRLSSFLFSILLLGPVMSTSAWAQQLAPERTFQEMLESLPREDVRPLTKGNLSPEEKSTVTAKLMETLRAKEQGKKWTIKFNRGKGGNLYDTNKANTEFYATSADIVRVNGVNYRVDVRVAINPTMMDKVKECAQGRKIFVSGTVRSLLILNTTPLTLGISMEADDLGRAKG